MINYEDFVEWLSVKFDFEVSEMMQEFENLNQENETI